MISGLASFALALCLRAATASYAENALSDLTSSAINQITAINTNNVGTGATFLDTSMVAFSQLVQMENTVDRLSEEVKFKNIIETHFRGLDFATKSDELPLIHLTYLDNADRSIESMGITVLSTPFNPSTQTSTPEVITGSVSSCSYTAFSLQVKTAPSLEIVQFAVYTDSSGIEAGDIIVRETSIIGKIKPTILVNGYPKFVFAGAVILAKSSGNPLSNSDTRGIVEIVAGPACEILNFNPFKDCLNGIANIDGNGNPLCSCNANYLGPTCATKCINGRIMTIPPRNLTVCECNIGWGGLACDIESTVSNFVTRARRTAKECQSRLTGHAEYVYKNPDSNPSGVPGLISGIVQSSALETRFNASTPQTAEFEKLLTTPYHVTMDRSNDLLAAAHIPGSNPSSGGFSVEHKDAYIMNDPSERITSSSGDVGVCSYHYTIVQRYFAGFPQAAAGIFFVSGVQDISIVPTNSSLSTVSIPGTKTDIWTPDGPMSDVVVGFTLIGRNEEGEMSVDELSAVAQCYALEGCHSLPIECGSGEQTNSPIGPICECTGDVTGVQCQLPLC